MADGPVLVLDDNDSPTVVVVQNDLLRYLFAPSLRWCSECGEQGVDHPWTSCDICGGEQIEPFRAGWDESD